MEFQDKYDGLPLKDLAKAQVKLEDQHAKAKAKAAAIWKEREFLAQVAIPNTMEELGLATADIAGVGKISIQDNLYAKVPPENKFDLQEWLRDNGYGDLIQGTVNSSTLSAQVRRWISSGEDWPDDLIELNTFTAAKITRVR